MELQTALSAGKPWYCKDKNIRMAAGLWGSIASKHVVKASQYDAIFSPGERKEDIYAAA